jgi:DNA-binding transcriptional LysR family regulator
MEGAPLNVPRLRVLFELTRRGSVTSVAEALWMTPSAVSQHLATLEREVGVKLVTRAGRGVQPTEAGRRLAEDAERVLAALDLAQTTARGLGGAEEGRLRVAAFPSVVFRVLAPALADLRRAAPDLIVEVGDVEGAIGLDRVRLGRADVAIVDDWGWDVGIEHRGLTLTPLLDDPLMAVLPADHALAAATEVRWSDLAGEPWVAAHDGSLFSQHVAAQCRRVGFEPLVRARVQDLSAHVALVGALGLVAVLPRLAAVMLDGVVARPLTPAVQRRLIVVTRSDRAGAEGVQGLLGAIERAAAAVREG